ncbi:hypothetical protein AB0J52_41500 [Spirillospora sp. NPDC049652]
MPDPDKVPIESMSHMQALAAAVTAYDQWLANLPSLWQPDGRNGDPAAAATWNEIFALAIERASRLRET